MQPRTCITHHAGPRMCTMQVCTLRYAGAHHIPALSAAPLSPPWQLFPAYQASQRLARQQLEEA